MSTRLTNARGPDGKRRAVPVIFGKGRSKTPEGRQYTLAWQTLEAEFGPFTSRFIRFEAARVALLQLNLRASMQALVDARERRAKRPHKKGSRELLRLANRDVSDAPVASAATTPAIKPRWIACAISSARDPSRAWTSCLPSASKPTQADAP